MITSNYSPDNFYAMEGCLLCLELKKEFVDTIIINSNQWNELNIKNVLEKHMWPMTHIENSSWLCTSCWRELLEFHTFYMRVEDTHRNYGLLTKDRELVKTASSSEENFANKTEEKEKSKIEGNSCDELEEIPDDTLKEFLNEYNLNHDNFQDLKVEEKKFPIKSVEESTDTNPLLQKRKRGRPRKDVCETTNMPKSVLSKDKKYGMSKKKNCKEIKINEIRKKKAGTIAKGSMSRSTDESERVLEINLMTESGKQNWPLDGYNDYNIDIDGESLSWNENKSDVNTNCTKKINHNEKDTFLAENFKITCFLCKIPFETFFNMRKHFDEHHTERGHVKCCNKKFYRRSVLVDHVHYHLNPNYFKCSQCGKVMADRRCLELHVEIHESSNEKIHCCDICGKGFAKLAVLKKHRMIHLSEEEKRFSCSDCSKNFASNYLLSSHYRSVHLKKYTKICDICGKSIRCKDVFERHMLQHEGKPAPSVNCDICGLILTDKKALKRHKDIIHPVGGQHEYTCSICSKTSPNLRAHKRHVQYKHVMGYDYKCTICDKAFKRAPTLREHMASHTGTILYTCPWCPKTFNSNANMHNHRKKVHPREWEEASRKRYSGNLPPNYKPPTVNETVDFTEPLDI